MTKSLSKKGLNIAPSVTLSITAKAKEMKDSGVDVISFGAGEPDYNTPENIQNEGVRAIREGLTRYTPASGILSLKKAIVKKFKNDNNLNYGTENIIISSGAKHSIYNALMAIINPGDEIIVSTPYWVSYPEMIKIAGGKPVYIETKEENNFKFDVKDLKKIKTDKTKGLILNTPSNPTGAIYSENELKEISEWAYENGVFIISDEIYEELVYDGEHISIATVSDKAKDNIIVINGVSKAYAMTGWRIGYAAGREDIIKIMSNIQSHTTSNPCSISQYASVEALEGSQESLKLMKKEFKKRRDYMADKINTIDGLSCQKPNGAFYIMVNIKEILGKKIKGHEIIDSVSFSKFLLEEAKIAVIPGAGFGSDNYIRLSYATSMKNIREGLDRLEEVLG